MALKPLPPVKKELVWFWLLKVMKSSAILSTQATRFTFSLIFSQSRGLETFQKVNAQIPTKPVLAPGAGGKIYLSILTLRIKAWALTNLHALCTLLILTFTTTLSFLLSLDDLLTQIAQD